MSPSAPDPSRAPRAALVAGVAMLLLACGGGGGGSSSPPPVNPAQFTASGTALAPNLVRIEGANAGANTLTLRIRIGGPTTSTDVYAFAFELLLANPGMVQQISATTAGTALSGTVQAVASMSGSRIVVGVTKQGGGAGNQIAADATIVDITLRLTAGTSTVRLVGPASGVPSPNPAALDSTATVIPSIVFDAANATITQP